MERAKQKEKLKNLLEVGLGEMPQMVQTTVCMFRPTICRAIDNLTGEQIDDLLDKADAVIEDVRTSAEDD